ncbi:MAG: polyamine ABC transporter ATP-binding protein [Alphaproteobacteria bacterium]|mgnify:CR=1 FL=1|jgi:putrescine transport system ATP-binding protein|nr:polyamine ABC transporter ATP-binding protein [Alphaproteobacteria bacterium]MBT5389793.1 polyamine ABC transporter ATP-binding protein [Alphaproteobacteria bacterium]MBT5540119.1 polyamine ABC transporter ATP-binding protein [Alphaproteobacteria bacterium]MBT5655041.1 polyamine ABC transporter ATP-binding protein [Alphaproteobacteria bacterium]
MTVQKKQLEPWQDPSISPYIQIENVSKDYDGIPAITDLSLSIYKGEFFSLLGASGCGKTTLLRILAGFETPSAGRIFIDGVDMSRVPSYERPVNMMFQSYALFPHMTVAQNVAFGLKQEGLPKSEIVERVKEALQLVQMTSYSKRKPYQLSGGQKQRVALARSIIKRPKLLLLDEPLAALDKKLRERTQFELVNIQESIGITFVMVTHDQEEAMTVSTRLGIMEEGHVRQVGSPHEIYEFPNSRYVADFIGSINIFDGTVVEEDKYHVLVHSEEDSCNFHIARTSTAPIGAQVSVGIRPEKIIVSKEKPQGKLNTIKGIVDDIAYLGDVSIYHVRLPSGKIIQATLPNLARLTEQPLTWEDKVYLQWRPENGMVLAL